MKNLKKSLSTLTDEAIALMRQMRTLEKGSPEYTTVEQEWGEVQKQIAAAGNHSMSKSTANAIARSKR